MKRLYRAAGYSLFCIIVLAQNAALAQNTVTNLIQNGNFTSITYSGSKPLTTVFGEFGTGSTNNTLTLGNWSTSGYNFVFAPGTIDTGTAVGANSGQPNEAPGAYKAANGYGNTYMWGSNNGGASTFPSTDPGGGDFIASDGAFQTGAVTQTITGLTVGNVYELNFYWGAAQQQGTSYINPTTENWQVSLGSQSFTTTTFSLPAKSFSGWMAQTYFYTATSASEVLSFLAGGTPNGQPPFSLLGDVSLYVVPEPSTWVLFAGFGAAGTVFGIIRRRRRLSCPADD